MAGFIANAAKHAAAQPLSLPTGRRYTAIPTGSATGTSDAQLRNRATAIHGHQEEI